MFAIGGDYDSESEEEESGESDDHEQEGDVAEGDNLDLLDEVVRARQ